MISAENDVEDRKHISEIPVVMLGVYRMMDAMYLRHHQNAIQPWPIRNMAEQSAVFPASVGGRSITMPSVNTEQNARQLCCRTGRSCSAIMKGVFGRTAPYTNPANIPLIEQTRI